ncbi:UNVERIFIED_CONTAM: putative protein phosphatase 2C 22 [Sesamum latifolium]|uniref:protein-serine/threonine phosphatase n=1 Tax=Sesamum latifolium TaxID=2727402 RepID=A0AAW2SN72_9LAMI
MEGSRVISNNVDGSRENCSSADGRPPIPNSIGGRGAYRHSFNSNGSTPLCTKSLVRHPSLVKIRSPDISIEPRLGGDDGDAEYMPLLRSGAWADIGSRSNMEDVYVCADNLMHDYGLNTLNERPSAFYGVFDGHGGKHAADFACYHLPRFIVEDEDFPQQIERVMSSAFYRRILLLRKPALWTQILLLAPLLWLLFSLVVANAGDCRAVLCRRGKAIEMSRDHKPVCLRERRRIEASGGYVYDGYLNGQLNVARALGDWHMEGLKGQDGGPLTAEPELMSTKLTEEDEFLIIGCDGIWDVFMSQNAVDFARRRLQEHNDPVMCSRDLVDEALKRKSGDNLSVVVVCFQAQPPPNLIVPRGRVQRSISAEGLKELQSFLDNLDN